MEPVVTTGTWAGEIWDRRKNGQIYPKWLTITAVKNKENEITQFVGIFSDITSRKQAEERIHYLAYFDALTNIPNRRLLYDRINLAISLSERTHRYGAILLLDMDKFKMLNDAWGHEYGDLLLIEVASRIQTCLRIGDTVARLGGDEFVILFEEVSENEKIALHKVSRITEKIRKELTRVYHIKEHEYHCSPSIGVCLFTGNEKSVIDLLKSADMAMYHAKESGRNTICFFDPKMQEEVERRTEVETRLRGAVAKKELQLYYQVQVNENGNPVGVEALLRWKDRKLGSVSPSRFIPVAEESSLILEIGNWVIDTACRQIAMWSSNERKKNLTVSVNISPRQFGVHNFVEVLERFTKMYHIDASRLKLELTENIILDDIANVILKMQAIKNIGIQLSIDDFGTGYSSLYYLKKLPLSQLKIDQSFIHDISSDTNDAVMVKTIIGMARNFHLNVIAEGVETHEQLDFLAVNGCESYQGYLFGRPVPVDEFEDYMELAEFR